MKTAALVLGAIVALASHVSAQTTAFTYQGQLRSNNAPANGNFDLKFNVYATSSGGSALTAPTTDPSVEVSNGVFTVLLDFGAGVFTGTDRWLEIGVRAAGDTNPHTTLNPRQLISATPYALRAETAATATTVTGPIADSQLSANIARFDNSIAGASILNLRAEFPILTLETNTDYNAADIRMVRQGQLKWSMALGPTSGDSLIFSSGAGKSLSLSQNGFLGIGNGLPRAPLEVTSSDSPSVVRIQSTSSFGSGKIEFWSDPVRTATEWHPASIRSIDNGNYTGGLSFLVNGTGFANATSEVEVMRLVNGKVGIGTSNPVTKLDVAGTVAINGTAIINAVGEWVGSPTGLVGPQGLAGAVGPQGPAGAIGPQGPTGAIGPQGPTGAIGPQGPVGPEGPAGVQGLAGSAGADGKTVRNGTGVPASSTGATGDFFINTAAETIYGPKTVSGWGNATSLIGPQGPVGQQGVPGLQGATGATGATGAPGADGKTVRNGTTAPASSVGVVGDFYINTTADTIYGPKTASGWGAATPLIGPQGPAGPSIDSVAMCGAATNRPTCATVCNGATNIFAQAYADNENETCEAVSQSGRCTATKHSGSIQEGYCCVCKQPG